MKKMQPATPGLSCGYGELPGFIIVTLAGLRAALDETTLRYVGYLPPLREVTW